MLLSEETTISCSGWSGSSNALLDGLKIASVGGVPSPTARSKTTSGDFSPEVSTAWPRNSMVSPATVLEGIANVRMVVAPVGILVEMFSAPWLISVMLVTPTSSVPRSSNEKDWPESTGPFAGMFCRISKFGGWFEMTLIGSSANGPSLP